MTTSLSETTTVPTTTTPTINATMATTMTIQPCSAKDEDESKKQLLASPTLPASSTLPTSSTLPAGAKIIPISIHVVVWEFLAAEYRLSKNKADIEWNLGEHFREYLEKPVFTGVQNLLRERALCSFRRWIWEQLPRDTQAWKVSNFLLTRSIFDQHMTRGWSFTTGKTQPVCLDGIIFFSPEPSLHIPTHEALSSLPSLPSLPSSSKLFLLEGNHRISQWMENGCPDTPVDRFYILTSPSQTPLHWVDPKRYPLKIEFTHGTTYLHAHQLRRSKDVPTKSTTTNTAAADNSSATSTVTKIPPTPTPPNDSVTTAAVAIVVPAVPIIPIVPGVSGVNQDQPADKPISVSIPIPIPIPVANNTSTNITKP